VKKQNILVKLLDIKHILIIYSKKSIYCALNELNNKILVNIFHKLFSSKKFRRKRLKDSTHNCYQTKNEKNY
jgi:hypothetical protein